MLPMLALVARPATSAQVTYQQTHAITGAAPGLGLEYHAQHELACKELQKRFPDCLVSVALDGELPLDARASFKAHTADGVAWRLEHPMRPYNDWQEPVRMVSHAAEGHGTLTVAVRERGSGRVLPLGVRVESSANHRYLELQPGARFVAKEGTWKISEPAGMLHKSAGAFPVLVEITAGQRHHEEIWIDGPLAPVQLRPTVAPELSGTQAVYLFTNAAGKRVHWHGTAREAREQTLCLPPGRWTVEVPDHSKPLAFELLPDWQEPVTLELEVTLEKVLEPR